MALYSAAVVGYYKGNGNAIIDIDAVQSVDDVTVSVFKALDGLNGQG